MKLDLDFTWLPVESTPGKPYLFPNPITIYLKEHGEIPAVYQWKVHKSGESFFYVGETSLLTRRIHGYLSPGPSQETNKRIREEFDKFLERGFEIGIDSMRINSLALDDMLLGQRDLHSTELRRTIEGLVIYKYRHMKFNLLNR